MNELEEDAATGASLVVGAFAFFFVGAFLGFHVSPWFFLWPALVAIGAAWLAVYASLCRFFKGKQ